jgi:hypothetical protein
MLRSLLFVLGVGGGFVHSDSVESLCLCRDVYFVGQSVPVLVLQIELYCCAGRRFEGAGPEE